MSAVNLSADLLKEGCVVNYATRSKAFTETLGKKLGTRIRTPSGHFDHYSQAGANEIDVLIMDEAYRIRRSGNHRFDQD